MTVCSQPWLQGAKRRRIQALLLLRDGPSRRKTRTASCKVQEGLPVLIHALRLSMWVVTADRTRISLLNPLISGLSVTTFNDALSVAESVTRFANRFASSNSDNENGDEIGIHEVWTIAARSLHSEE